MLSSHALSYKSKPLTLPCIIHMWTCMYDTSITRSRYFILWISYTHIEGFLFPQTLAIAVHFGENADNNNTYNFCNMRFFKFYLHRILLFIFRTNFLAEWAANFGYRTDGNGITIRKWPSNYWKLFLHVVSSIVNWNVYLHIFSFRVLDRIKVLDSSVFGKIMEN